MHALPVFAWVCSHTHFLGIMAGGIADNEGDKEAMGTMLEADTLILGGNHDRILAYGTQKGDIH